MLSDYFQESLKKLRTKNNLTQDELGKKLGVSGQTIYKYENGITFPPPEKIDLILHFFKVEPNVLFGYNSHSENINRLLTVINSEAHLQAEISNALKLDDKECVVKCLKAEYPFLEQQDLNLMLSYNKFIFETTTRKYIEQEIERIKKHLFSNNC